MYRTPLPERLAATRPTHLVHLDGLRGLAVASVVAYHFNVPGTRGGFLGVDLFFGLSGFLITGLLLQVAPTWASLGTFYQRRFWRLAPALVVLVLVATVVARSSAAAPMVREHAGATLLFGANWAEIWSRRSSAHSGLINPLRHTWSLSIEEQFYLVFPPILLACRRWAARWRAVAITIVSVFAIASVVSMRAHRNDLLHAYWGTDARAHELLAGCLAALLLHGQGRPDPRKMAWAATGSLTVLLLAFHIAKYDDVRLYEGGLAIIGILVAVLVASVSLLPSRSLIARVLGWRPLAALGLRAYSLYLWHHVVLMWTRSLDWPAVPLLAIRLTASLILAEASYALVEQPLRERGRRPAASWATLGGLALTLGAGALLVRSA